MDRQAGHYVRQQTLDIEVPNMVAVIGLGGVGSWVALNMAIAGVGEIILIDADEVDSSNLGRTPYREYDIGTPKAASMMEIIGELRADCNALPYVGLVENMDNYTDLEACDHVFDCRDVADPLPPTIQAKVRAIGGYNGNNVTLHLNPNPVSIWGDLSSGGYEITPSYLVPPQFIAWFITAFILEGTWKTITTERIANFTIGEFMSHMMEDTFLLDSKGKGGLNE